MEVEVMNIAEVNEKTKEQGFVLPRFKEQESAVYETLCPSKSTYNKQQILESDDIPQRIKEAVEMTRDRFYRFEVWESENYEIKDPILLGREKDPEKKDYSWCDRVFLIGRWGTELESFSVLKEKALAIIKRRVRRELLKAKADIESRLADVDLFVEEAFDKGETDMPNLRLGMLS